MSNFLKNMNKELVLKDDTRWSLLEKLYDDNYINNINNPNKEERIPKIIHQIWLGGKLPDKYNYYIDTIKNNNMDWEYRLWTDNDVKNFGLRNEVLFNNIRNLGAKSDILRLEILERFGGIYLDTDFFGIKSFNDLIYLDFFAGTGQSTTPEIYNSLIGSSPNGKFIHHLVNKLSEIYTFNDNIDGVMNTTGPFFLEREFYNNINDNVVIFPTSFFFPFPAVERFIYQNSNYINEINKYNNENTHCVHMWHTTWQK